MGRAFWHPEIVVRKWPTHSPVRPSTLF
jgi:hypothetical protein